MPSKKTKKNRTILSDEFYSDLKMQDMLYAVLIRSPKKAGLIADIELPENFPEPIAILDCIMLYPAPLESISGFKKTISLFL